MTASERKPDDVNTVSEHGPFTGRSLPRREDPRFLTGRGLYTADVQLPGMLHAAFLRSPHAHARLVGIDTAAALATPGCVAVFTAADLAGRVQPLPGALDAVADAWKAVVHTEKCDPSPPLLVADEAMYVGQPVAMVVAENRAMAEDALEAIDVEWETLPAVIDPEAALQPGSHQAHALVPDNVHFRLRTGKGDVAAALAQAPHRLQQRLYHHRYTAVPMEGRAVLCNWDARRGVLQAWVAGQSAYNRRKALAGCLGLAQAQVEVYVPDVGGGFGPKLPPYTEDVVVAHASRHLGRPVRWVEDRNEHFQSTYHARDQIHYVDFACGDDGRLLALHTRAVFDCGAFNPIGLNESGNGAAHLLGPYRTDHYAYEATGACTNKTPHYVYRGAGRPEVCFVMERVMDRIADHLGLDRAEVRRRNMIPAAAMPYDQGLVYRSGAQVVYDSGDYPTCLDKALAAIGYDDIRRRQQDGWRQGRYVGVGLGCYVEATAAGPFMGARVRLDGSGRIVVISDAINQGQGHETTLVQLAADIWRTTPDQIVLQTGDSVHMPHGYGSSGSRTMVLSGTAIHAASQQVQAQIRLVAAMLLEAAPADLEIVAGRVCLRGAPFRNVTLAQVARAVAPGPQQRLPAGVHPDLEATRYHIPAAPTWAYAVQAAEVEVDAETGQVRVVNYVIAHDSGVIINPRLADGQVLGGVVQGLGGALLEELVYDDAGQLLTGSLMDYLLPTACDVPPMQVVHMETPSPLNPLGIKGLGEGGAIAPPAAIAGAVEDALRPLGVRIDRTPISPQNLFAWLQAARAQADPR